MILKRKDRRHKLPVFPYLFIRKEEQMKTLWHNGIIYTMNKENETAEAVVTENGRIVFVGPKKEADLFHAPFDRMISLEGAVMFPGFVDSHMHLIGLGEKLGRLDLTDMKSKREILAAVKDKLSSLKEGEWLIGEGWDENRWGTGEVITKDDLDQISDTIPILLKRVCRHTVVANTPALKKAGIDETSVDPEGGKIERDEDGQLTGILKDRAIDKIFQTLPKYTKDDLRKILEIGVQHCWENGLTGAHTEDLNYYGDFWRTYRAFDHVIHRSSRKFRAHLLVHHEVIDEWRKAGFDFLFGSPFLEFGAMKIFADGSLGSRTALLSAPYKDDPGTNGLEIHPNGRLTELVKKAREMGLPVAIHAIGDLAVERVLDVLDRFPPIRGRRDRIIHANVLRMDLIARLKKQNNLVLDIQPGFIHSDVVYLHKRLPNHLKTCVSPWKTILTAGIRCAGGSDAPIEEVNPFKHIGAVVERADGRTNERLSVYEGVSLYTKGSAFACHHELDRGRIQNGYKADFTIVDRDVFCLSPEEILKTKIVMTVIDDELVYSVF